METMRKILQGQGTEEGKATHVHLLRAMCGQTEKNKKCLPFRALLQVADELQVRRVRWYQSWARCPKDHHAVVTAVLGTCKAEDIVGVQRLTSEGNVCQTSTPMARQMADDLLKVSQLSEEAGAWYEQRTNDVAIFTPGCWDRVRYLEFPVEELRGGENGLLCPRVRERANGRNRWETGRAGRTLRLCNERFASCRQLMAHETRKHGVRTVLGLLTRTNECPWCRSRFVDRETALHHVYSATETKGTCYINFSRCNILSSCLMTCSVDCVTPRPKILRHSNRTRDRTTLIRKDLSKLAMGGWSGQERDSRGRKSSARDGKLSKNGGKGSMKASARSAASYEDTPGRSIVALQKLSLNHDQEMREPAGALTDFWLAPKSLQAVKAGMEAGADYMEEVNKRGRGHGL